MNIIRRLNRSIKVYIHDVAGMCKLAGDSKSKIQFAVDRFLMMGLGRIWVPGNNQERQMQLNHLNGRVLIQYRLNRGDIKSITELWLDRAYKLPTDTPRRVLVDLGANIGMTSLWLASYYSCEKIVAIEPSKSNANLVCKNFEANTVPGKVIEAAVGPSDGTAKFEDNVSSNQGRVGTSGFDVRMICMTSLLNELLPDENVDLLKVDIEGGEEALFKANDISWLGRVQEIIIEFHPAVVDYPGLISILKNQGFDYFAPGSLFPDSMDYFRRKNNNLQS